MNNIHGMCRLRSKQWLAALAASMAMINVGIEEFWIPRSMKNMGISGSTSQKNQNFIVAGLCVAAICGPFGAILGALLADRFGRKKTLLVTSFFTIIQIISSFTTNSALSFVALFLGLIGLGLTRVAVPLYISEIVDDDIRGTLLMLQLPFFFAGKLIAVGIGKLVSAEIVGVILLIVTIIFLISFIRLPETPYYLASKKRNEAATRSLAFYRGIESLAAENEVDEIMKNDSQGCCARIKELVRPTNRKGLLIIMFLVLVKWSEQVFEVRNQFMGFVLDKVVSPEHQTKLLGHATSLIISIVTVFTIDVIGRRPFLLYSHFVGFIGMVIFSVALAGGFSVIGWVHDVVSTAVYLCQLFFYFVILVYGGELFSPNVKAVAIAICTSFDLLISVLILLLMETVVMDVSSYIGPIVLLVAFPMTFAFIPETKRKSFPDIQSELATTFHCRWLKKKLTRNHVK